MILEPLVQKELDELFDELSLKVFRECIDISLEGQPPLLLNQKTLPIHIPKEHVEQ